MSGLKNGVSIRSIAQHAFEIGAAVITDPATFARLQSRHVGVGPVVAWSTPEAINRTANWKKVTIVVGSGGSGMTYGALASSHRLKGVAVLMSPQNFSEELRKLDKEKAARDEAFVKEVKQFLQGRIDASGHQLRADDVPITLILDDMGETMNLVRALCSTQSEIRKILQEVTKSTSQDTRLIGTGRGVSEAALAPGLGSLDWFQTVRIV
jgi:hypothetical protein